MRVAEQLAKGGCERDCRGGRQEGRWAGQIGVGMSGCFDALSYRGPQSGSRASVSQEWKRRARDALSAWLSFFLAPPASLFPFSMSPCLAVRLSC